MSIAALVAALFLSHAAVNNGAEPGVFAVLAGLAALAYLAEVRLKTFAYGGYFNAGIVLAIVTLAVAGPLPALIVWWIPDGIARIVLRREPIFSPGHVATVSGYAAALIAGHALLSLQATGAGPLAELAVLYGAGLAMHAVNFAVTVLCFSPFYENQRVLSLIRSEYLDVLPAYVSMLALAATTTLLIPTIGVLALAPLGIAILLPQFVLAQVVRERSAARLAPPAATALYAQAIADVLGTSRRERRVLALAAGEPTPEPIDGLESLGAQITSWIRELAATLRHDSDREHAAARLVARRSGEAVDGGDPPDIGALLSPAPQLSRVLTVARAWAALTAAGTPGLSHSEALLLLRARAGREFDALVVAAAEQVVSEEEAFVRDPDFQPQLHRLPLPRPVRRGLAPALLRRLAAPA